MKRVLLGVLVPALFVSLMTPVAASTGADESSVTLTQEHDWVEVGGVLHDDTTWTAEGGPYQVTQAVEIPSDVTLTIEAGTYVEVNVDWGDSGFVVNGALRAQGTATDRVHLRAASVSSLLEVGSNDPTAQVDLEFVNAYQAYRPGGGELGGQLIAPGSGLVNLQNVSVDGFSQPMWDVRLHATQSYFLRMGHFSVSPEGVGTFSESRFIDPQSLWGGAAFVLFTEPGSETLNLENNVFEGSGTVITEELYGDFEVDVSGNYWGTTDRSEVEARIRTLDPYDDEAVTRHVMFEPFLAERPIPDRPVTTIDNDPPWETRSNIQIEFSSEGEGIIGHECRMVTAGDERWQACSSPVEPPLGTHGREYIIQVRAINDRGEVAPAAQHAWLPVTEAPSVSITSTSSPGGTSGDVALLFFESNPPSDDFTCTHGGRTWECESPVMLEGLNPGQHRFSVVATDDVGNISEPAVHEWTVEDSSTAPSETPGQIFSDVPVQSTHGPNIARIYDAGITTGYPDGTFGPRESVTREQMASLLDRALDLPDASAGSFPDVSGTHARAVDRVAAAGITTGFTDGTFGPRESVTREQMASFLDRALDLPEAPAGSFPDVSGTHARAVDRVAAAGITTGFADGTFGPRRQVTREQMASFLARALHLDR